MYAYQKVRGSMKQAFIEMICNRRSIRKWKDTQIQEDIIANIIESGCAAPSTHGAKPWEFIILTDTLLINEILSDRLQMKDAPFFINSRDWAIKNGLEKYSSVQSPPLLIIICGNKTLVTDMTGLIASLSCAAENMLLASHAENLGACLLFAHDVETPTVEQRIRRVLHIPEHILIFALIAIGYSDEDHVEKQSGETCRIHRNGWEFDAKR